MGRGLVLGRVDVKGRWWVVGMGPGRIYALRVDDG